MLWCNVVQHPTVYLILVHCSVPQYTAVFNGKFVGLTTLQLGELRVNVGCSFITLWRLYCLLKVLSNDNTLSNSTIYNASTI